MLVVLLGIRTRTMYDAVTVVWRSIKRVKLQWGRTRIDDVVLGASRNEHSETGSLIAKLDRTERWDQELSLGEQERLAFARLLLHKPGWVFLDEATAALDEDSQRRVMRLFDDELKQTTVLSIGHRPDLAVYHTRTLQLVHGLDGDRLKLKPPPAPPPPRRWLQRLDDWLLTIRS